MNAMKQTKHVQSFGIRGNRKMQSGFALITTALILVALTLIGLSLYQSAGHQEKSSGNMLESQRAFQASQSALQQAEWWLRQAQSNRTPQACPPANNTQPVVCSNPLSNPISASSWRNAFEVKNLGLQVDATGGLVASGANAGDVNYTESPKFYIYKVPGSTYSFVITAIGYGGRGGTISVVQTNYTLSGSAKCVSCP